MSSDNFNNSNASARPWFERLDRIDRRWIFLLMFLAVSGPVLWIGITGKTLPEAPTLAARSVFQEIDQLPARSLVLISFDYDPASAGELQPMATSLVRQSVNCAMRCSNWPGTMTPSGRADSWFGCRNWQVRRFCGDRDCPGGS